jgi:hypothetical protein
LRAARGVEANTTTIANEANMKESYFDRERRVRTEERVTAKALYGWSHPANVEWARQRDIAGARSLREWCRHLENRLRAIEERQHDADVADEPEAPVADEPQTPVAGEQLKADEAVGDETPATKSPARVSIRWEGRR